MDKLIEMGFDPDIVAQTLKQTGGNFEEALCILTGGSSTGESLPEPIFPAYNGPVDLDDVAYVGEWTDQDHCERFTFHADHTGLYFSSGGMCGTTWTIDVEAKELVVHLHSPLPSGTLGEERKGETAFAQSDLAEPPPADQQLRIHLAEWAMLYMKNSGDATRTPE